MIAAQHRRRSDSLCDERVYAVGVRGQSKRLVYLKLWDRETAARRNWIRCLQVHVVVVVVVVVNKTFEGPCVCACVYVYVCASDVSPVW